MAVKISYSKTKINKSSSNIVLFSNDKFNTSNLKNSLSNSEMSYINGLLKSSDLKKNMFVFEINAKKNIILILFLYQLKII